jgi:hypothetical protein
MATIAESVVVAASLADTWERYLDPRGWPAWVDGFGGIEASDGYPEVGGTLAWHSVPAGRGRVSERVLEHEPRRIHRIAFSDPDSEGELAARFAIEPGGEERPATRVTLELEYRLYRRDLFMRLSDVFFIRGQLRGSLQRSLARFRAEAEEATDA